jgi:hypothetical protein
MPIIFTLVLHPVQVPLAHLLLRLLLPAPLHLLLPAQGHTV